MWVLSDTRRQSIMTANVSDSYLIFAITIGSLNMLKGMYILRKYIIYLCKISKQKRAFGELLLSVFCSEYKYLLILQKMYVYCVYPAMSENP